MKAIVFTFVSVFVLIVSIDNLALAQPFQSYADENEYTKTRAGVRIGQPDSIRQMWSVYTSLPLNQTNSQTAALSFFSAFSSSSELEGLLSMFKNIRSSPPPQTRSGKHPEIQEILALSETPERSEVFQKLLERVGAEEAQEALVHSGLPPTGETHLIQHLVGGYLYETEGSAGIVKCKLYFQGACYHDFIILLLSREGENALTDAMDECKKFGQSTANICSHGIGHGFLVWYGYGRLVEAAEGCDRMAEKVENFSMTHCLEGVFMENQWALHAGGESPDQWLSETDPYYPCSDPRIKNEWLLGCWTNQGAVMFHFFKGNIREATDACRGLPNPDYRRSCLESLVRQIHPYTENKVLSAISMCTEMGEWKNQCLEELAVSDYGQGGRDLPYRICESISAAHKDACYERLSRIIAYFAQSREDVVRSCSLIFEKKYREQCTAFSGF